MVQNLGVVLVSFLVDKVLFLSGFGFKGVKPCFPPANALINIWFVFMEFEVLYRLSLSSR